MTVEEKWNEKNRYHSFFTVLFNLGRWNSYKYRYCYNIDTAIKKLKNGLSFFAGIPTAKCVLTTVEWVRSTGTLYANNNHGNHYGILPVKGDLKAWMATKNTANTNPHEYSITLKNITIPI